MRYGLAAVVLVACTGSSAPPAHPTAPAAPAHRSARERIEGTWSFEKWDSRGDVFQAPDIGGIWSLRDGIATFQLNVSRFHNYIYCIGYYKFTENDTVLTIGWNRCAKFHLADPKDPNSQYVADFDDEWDGMVPVLPIRELPNGDLSLEYNADNEHGRVVKHGGFGWDFLFHADDTLEYWNHSESDGKKSNVKTFRKLYAGDPSKHF
jgi:hypothetical protein